MMVGKPDSVVIVNGLELIKLDGLVTDVDVREGLVILETGKGVVLLRVVGKVEGLVVKHGWL
jgi:hypothetical protein